jgi:hypothetical protein
VTLPRPLCVIRHVKTQQPTSEDKEEEIDVSDMETALAKRTTMNLAETREMPNTPSEHRISAIPAYLTLTHKPSPSAPKTSSAPQAPNQRDCSSDLSSRFPAGKRTRSTSSDEDEPQSVKRKAGGGAGRTRQYQAVAIVRRKIVFALR